MFALLALPTAQVPDFITIEGEKLALYANPLESFLRILKQRPRLFHEPYRMSTANWRGYVANWAIIKGELYLTGIEAFDCPIAKQPVDARNCKRVTLESMFPDKVTRDGVLASWFTGKLTIPKGKMLQYVHMGYGSVYEGEIVLEVEKGKLIRTQKIDNRSKQRPSSLELERLELEKMRNESKRP